MKKYSWKIHDIYVEIRLVGFGCVFSFTVLQAVSDVIVKGPFTRDGTALVPLP